MKLSNNLGLPNSIVRAIENDPYSGGEADISTTRLIAPAQVVELARRHRDQIQEDASERVWALVGQAVHKIAERAATPGAIAEQRYFAEMEGWTVSGAVDLIENGELIDYKVTSVWTYIYGSRIDEWTEQGNVNRWLYNQNVAPGTGPEIKALRNILILRDWSAKDAAKRSDYPKTPIVSLPLEMWSDEKAREYVRQRVLLHQKARAADDAALPRCSDEETWSGRRCAKYCAGAAFCHQYQNSRASEDK